MMNKKLEETNRNQINLIALDQMVPRNHLLRKIDSEIDFTFIYDIMRPLYSEDTGRPSIDPVVLIKILLIQTLFGIRSIRQTIKEVEVNVAYRWFINYGFMESIPDYSTISQNYRRRLKLTDEEKQQGKKHVFEQIFDKVLEQVAEAGLLDLSELYFDATHIKASANKKKFTKEIVEVVAGKHIEELRKEIDNDRLEQGKKPIDWDKVDKNPETKEQIISTTDKDSGMFYKDEKEKTFCYKASTMCTKDNYIVSVETTAGNIHDSKIFSDNFDILIKDLKAKGAECIALDAGYKNPVIAKKIIESGLYPILPYTAPKGSQSEIRRNEFEYIKEINCYRCPENQPLWQETTNKEGYRVYKSDKNICKNCPRLKECTQSKNHQKVIQRHVWTDFLDVANDYRITSYHKEVYKKRKETIERVFADAKEKHAMRYTHLKGLERVKSEVTLKFAFMNLKKLAISKWRTKWTAYYEGLAA